MAAFDPGCVKTPTASQIASVRVFKTALPTLSVRDRAIMVLNHHRFWGYASGPSSSGNTLPSSMHGNTLAAVPYRASGLVLCPNNGHRLPNRPCPKGATSNRSTRRKLQFHHRDDVV